LQARMDRWPSETGQDDDRDDIRMNPNRSTRVTDRQTDGFAIAYSALSMLSRAKNRTFKLLSAPWALLCMALYKSFYCIILHCFLCETVLFASSYICRSAGSATCEIQSSLYFYTHRDYKAKTTGTRRRASLVFTCSLINLRPC